jgi:hypothetical protein
VLESPDQGVGFEWFLKRATEIRASSDEDYRLGFEGKHRKLDIERYSKLLTSKLFEYSPPTPNTTFLDIGAGGGELAIQIEKLCVLESINYVMVDSKEILEKGFAPINSPIYGRFPENLEEITNSPFSKKINYVLANSVIHYVKNDGLLNSFLVSVCNLLMIGGVAIIGDVPISEMKNAQSVANGNPRIGTSKNDFSWKDFENIAALISTLGCSLYLQPQPHWLPMHPHRADLVILKHSPLGKW